MIIKYYCKPPGPPAPPSGLPAPPSGPPAPPGPPSGVKTPGPPPPPGTKPPAPIRVIQDWTLTLNNIEYKISYISTPKTMVSKCDLCMPKYGQVLSGYNKICLKYCITIIKYIKLCFIMPILNLIPKF